MHTRTSQRETKKKKLEERNEKKGKKCSSSLPLTELRHQRLYRRTFGQGHRPAFRAAHHLPRTSPPSVHTHKVTNTHLAPPTPRRPAVDAHRVVAAAAVVGVIALSLERNPHVVDSLHPFFLYKIIIIVRRTVEFFSLFFFLRSLSSFSAGLRKYFENEIDRCGENIDVLILVRHLVRFQNF